MKFQGFDVFPMGDATLSPTANGLRVRNMGCSGLDGVLIKYDCDCDADIHTQQHTIHFGDLSSIVNDRGVLKTTTLKKNSLGQVVTAFETFKWYDEQSGKVIMGYNSSFIPNEFTLFGKLNGETVFEFRKKDLIDPYKPDPDEPNPPDALVVVITITATTIAVASLVVAVAALAVTVWSILRTTRTTTTTKVYDDDGKLISTSTSISEDPEPFEIEVNGETFTVTEFGIKFNEEIPAGLVGHPALDYCVVGEMITGCNLSGFEITSIE